MNLLFSGVAIVLFALVAITAIRTRMALFFARRGKASTSASATRSPLDVYEAAYLAGGPRRVVNTALVSLVSQGGVRVSSEGVVTPVQGFRPDKQKPVERAVIKQIKSAPGGCTTAEVRHNTVDDHAMRRLTTPLWRQGYLMAPADRVLSRRRTDRLLLFAVLATVVAVAGIVMRAQAAALVILAVTAVMGVACCFWLRRAMADPVTPAGKAALSEADVRVPVGGSWSSTDEIRLVALHGLTKLPDRQLADTLGRDTRVRVGTITTCCAPGHCGSYPGHSGGGSSEGGFFDFGGSHGGGYGGDYGGGMRRRIDIAASILNTPDLLFL
ncbi:TIGR04222 domain-containing membrane protein, partial [Nonomuraea turkmeniaca]